MEVHKGGITCGRRATSHQLVDNIRVLSFEVACMLGLRVRFGRLQTIMYCRFAHQNTISIANALHMGAARRRRASSSAR